MADSRISIITTCKGRLAHLRASLPTLVRAGLHQVIVVDYDCPDNTGDWIAAHFANVQVVRLKNRKGFNLAEARNVGAQAATGDYLFFIDADILLETQGIPEVQRLSGRYFLRCTPVQSLDRSEKQTWGTCIVKRSDFIEIGRYDEAYVLYGGEDADLYDRLKRRGVREEYFSETRFSSISHDDAMRTQYKCDADIWRSKRINRIYRTVKFKLEDSGYTLAATAGPKLFSAISTIDDLQNFAITVPVTDGMEVDVSTRRKYLLFGKPTYHVSVRRS